MVDIENDKLFQAFRLLKRHTVKQNKASEKGRLFVCDGRGI